MHGRLRDEKGQAGSGKGPPLARIVGSGLAFLSLHAFIYKMGRITLFAVGLGGSPETRGALTPPLEPEPSCLDVSVYQWARLP